MNKIQFFKRKVKELALKTNIKDEVVIRRDNRLGGYLACIHLYLYCDTQEPVYLFKYNSKLLKKKTKIQLIALALHELGHIKLRHEYWSFKKSSSLRYRIKMEYEAEKFAMEYIRKHYPKHFKPLVKDLAGYDENVDEVYKEAFVKLAKEYLNE